MNWNALKRGSMGRSEQLWITVLVGATAVIHGCEADEGTWHRCSVGPPGTPTRGSGSTLECLCPPGYICNYGTEPRDADRGLPDAPVVPDATVDDAGFSDAGPIDHTAIDALVASDAPMNDAAVDDDAAVDAPITDDAP